MMESNSRFVEARARHALRAAELPFDGPLTRASSTRNEVFLSTDYVVRTNRQPNQRLRREAMLYDHLPNDPRFPTGVHWGGEVGADYLVVERKPGGPLAHAWPMMTPVQRRKAVRDLSEMLALLHTTLTPPTLPRLDVATHLIDPRSVTALAPLFVEIDRLKVEPTVDQGLLSDVDILVNELAPAMNEFDQRTLIHGDLTFENMLWDGNGLSGLLDFEWCRGGSNDMDLDVLFRCCAFPEAHIDPDYVSMTRAEDYADVPLWFAEDRPDLFAHPAILDRLKLYCISFDIRDLAESLPVDRRSPDPMHPISRLHSMLQTGGHVTETMRRIGLRV